MRKQVSIGKEKFFVLCYEDCRYAGKDNECYANGYCARLEVDLYAPISEEGELSPEDKIKAFIKNRSGTYSVDDILDKYIEYKNGLYVGYSIEECIEHLEDEIKELIRNKSM